MATVVVNDTYLSDIADAIRAKSGTSNTYKPSEMAEAISNIGGGGSPDWVDITPDLSTVTNTAYAAHTYDSANDELRVYATASKTYQNAHVPMAFEEGVRYRMAYDVKAVGRFTVGAVAQGTGSIFGGNTVSTNYTKADSFNSFAFESVYSQSSGFETSANIIFYCTVSTAGSGDVTFKNFRLYKYVGGNS